MATASEKCEVDLLQPEILARNELCNILKTKQIKTVEELDQLDKYALVDLYYKYVLPLPQRSYRNNRRGRKMSDKQKLIDVKRKRSIISEDLINSKRRKTEDSGSNLSLTRGSVGDRLKPPPSAINFERKKICLSGKTSLGATNRLKPPPAVDVEMKKLSLNRLNTKNCEANSGTVNTKGQPVPLTRINKEVPISSSSDTMQTSSPKCEKTLTVVNPRLKRNSDTNETSFKVTPIKHTSIKLKRSKITQHNVKEGDSNETLTTHQTQFESSNHKSQDISKTTQMNCSDSVKSESSETVDLASTSEENVRKKFKKANISWP